MLVIMIEISFAANVEHRTSNAERRTPNAERRTLTSDLRLWRTRCFAYFP
jgi:hypothetical protein